MAAKPLNKIFLSASIPYKERDKQFYDSADFIAIRDSVKALATVVIPRAHLIWGGHPAITPLIRFVVERMKVNLKEHVTLYQSDYFSNFFPPDNFHFEGIQLIKKGYDRNDSLIKLREEMIIGNNYCAGVFIGGMEGVLEEFELFRNSHPKALTFPIASTGAAAKQIYERFDFKDDKLLNEYAYMFLFKDLFNQFI